MSSLEIINECFKISQINSSGNIANDLELLNEKLILLDQPLFDKELDIKQWEKLNEINQQFHKQYVDHKKHLLTSFDNFFQIVKPRLPVQKREEFQAYRNSLSPVLNISSKDILKVNHDLLDTFFESVSPPSSNTSNAKLEPTVKEVKSVVIELKMEPPKPPKSKGKQKKKELKAKREESHKPLPKKEKLKKQQEASQLKKLQQETSNEPKLSKKEKQLLKAEKKKAKREARQQRKNQNHVEEDEDPTDEINEEEINPSNEEDDDDSGPRSEGEFIDPEDLSSDGSETDED